MKTLDREWRARFEQFARTSAEEHEVSGWSPEGLSRRFKLFQQVVRQFDLPERARVLELGCGAGTYVRYLAGRGYFVIGMDYSLPTLGKAVEADPSRRGRYVAADGYALPFAPAAFDLVVCIGVFQALARPEHVLDEIARVLHPGGVILVEALNALGLPAAGRRLLHAARGGALRVRYYSPLQVRRWLEERGFRLLQREGVYLPPRRFPALGRILDAPGVIRLIERIPGGTLAGAHAFWLVGQTT